MTNKQLLAGVFFVYLITPVFSASFGLLGALTGVIVSGLLYGGLFLFTATLGALMFQSLFIWRKA